MSTHWLHCLAAAALVAATAGFAPQAAAQTHCGSAVLGERAQPAVFLTKTFSLQLYGP